MRLFVIGNGFDSAHGLKTSYYNFRDYLEQTDWEYLSALEEMYNYYPESIRKFVENGLWKEFEENLSNLNVDEFMDTGDIDMGLEGGDIDIEDTLDEYWEDQYGFISRLSDFLYKWIKNINLNVNPLTDKINNSFNDLFFTFNYTQVLEKVYGIDD